MRKVWFTRIWVIDLLRGLAVIGMIFYHFFFILDYFGVFEQALTKGLWLVLARIVQFTFLGLVGLSLTLSRSDYIKNFFRGLKIFLLGLAVTAVTYVFITDFVKFGILHIIGVSIIILAPLKNTKFISLFLAIFSYFFAILIRDIPVNSIFLYVLGFSSEFKSWTIDYFPIFPWISVILIGIFLGNMLKTHLEKAQTENQQYLKIWNPFLWFGRNSLLIYMIHIPLILFLLFIACLI